MRETQKASVFKNKQVNKAEDGGGLGEGVDSADVDEPRREPRGEQEGQVSLPFTMT